MTAGSPFFSKPTFPELVKSLADRIQSGVEGGAPSGITDFAAGSVAGTLVRAFAWELGLLYEQMEIACRRGFLDTAEGAALDHVVALLGVVRKPPDRGQPAESDSDLRNRARRELERAGKATRTALEYSLLKLEGVESVDILDHTDDASIPLGEVRVLVSGFDPVTGRDDWSGKMDVAAAIEATRAAGVRVRAIPAARVELYGTLLVIPSPGFKPEDAEAFKNLILQAVGSLKFGESVSIRRLAALVYQVPGLSEVAQIDLKCSRSLPDHPATRQDSKAGDIVSVARNEWIRVAKDGSKDRLEVVALARIGTLPRTWNAVQKAIELPVSISDTQGAIRAFQDFTLIIVLSFDAVSISASDRNPRTIGKKEYPLVFGSSGSETIDYAVLRVGMVEMGLGDMEPLGENPGSETGHPDAVTLTFRISARDYPGLQAADLGVGTYSPKAAGAGGKGA